ncbi:Rab family GTPase [Methylocystis iwaonis]|uniref:Rab family GTPase n=1 Tax=Methylocystis iwaonis TaxID=2885079 RepID=UPI002E7AD45A|nr:Rab family GTPase [Methylocystis iwaonis]
MISAKVMLLGDIGVGKSSLARRFVFDRFESDYKTTIGVDVLTHDVALGPDANHETLRFVLWDTDGDFGLRIFETVYLAGASAAIIVADATRPATLVKMAGLATHFEERFPGRPVAAIVNKIDLAPELASDASPSRHDVVYTSAKTGQGVAEMFLSLGHAIWRRAM